MVSQIGNLLKSLLSWAVGYPNSQGCEGGRQGMDARLAAHAILRYDIEILMRNDGIGTLNGEG